MPYHWRDGERLGGAMTQCFRERPRGSWIEIRGTVSEPVEQVLNALA